MCIFCKIINGDIPSYKIYEDEFTYVFLDIAKDVDGHTLVVPKKHVENILDCDNETLRHVIDTVKLVSNYYVNECGYDGVNVLNANDVSAQQSVFHLHFHIIPRKNGDGFSTWPTLPGAKEELSDVHQKLKM